MAFLSSQKHYIHVIGRQATQGCLWAHPFPSAWMMMYVTNWKQRLDHAELGWLPCCVSSRPRLHVRQNGPASAGLAPLSPRMWQHRQKGKPSTMSGERHIPM